MRLLLDTHALLWWLIDDPQLSAVAREAIADLENSEPLLCVTRMSIHASPDAPQFQHVELAAANLIEKK